jgi:hypothetical protein
MLFAPSRWRSLVSAGASQAVAWPCPARPGHRAARRPAAKAGRDQAVGAKSSVWKPVAQKFSESAIKLADVLKSLSDP